MQSKRFGAFECYRKKTKQNRRFQRGMLLQFTMLDTPISPQIAVADVQLRYVAVSREHRRNLRPDSELIQSEGFSNKYSIKLLGSFECYPEKNQTKPKIPVRSAPAAPAPRRAARSTPHRSRTCPASSCGCFQGTQTECRS